MFQRQVDKIFKDIPNVFGILDDVLVVGYDSDSQDHGQYTVRSSTDMQIGKHETK